MQKLMGRGKLIFLITFLLFLGFLGTNFISYKAAKDSLRDNIINTSLPLTRDNIYSEIQRDLMRPIFIASSMANDTFLKDWAINGEKNEESIKKYLSHIIQKYGFFTSFYVSANSMNYYYYDGILKKVSEKDPHDVWYYNFLKKHEPYTLEVDENQASKNKLTIFINHRVYDYSNRLIGVTGVGLDLERITNLLSEYQVKYDREIYLADISGNVQVRSNNISFKESNLYDVVGLKSYVDKFLKASVNSVNVEYDRDSIHYLLTARYIPELDWVLVVVQNQNQAVEKIWFNFLKNILLSVVITALVLLITAFAINHYHLQLEKIASTDHLTGTFNRREFSRIFSDVVERSKATSGVFSIILYDIDCFKDINDRFGHVAGDRVITRISEISSSCIRNSDMLARWGGDEFIIIVMGGLESTMHIAERISESVYSDSVLSSLLSGESVTLSMGVTVYKSGDSEDSLTSRADSALYRAKQLGRNRVETEV